MTFLNSSIEKEDFVAREMARQSLYFYSRWMFLKRRGFNWVRSGHHKLICDALTRVFNGDCRRLIINVPPRYAKTELAVLNFISWAMGRCPDAGFLHVSYSASLAIKNSSETRAILQHPEYQSIFPACRLKTDSKADWSTTEGGGIHAAGSGGSITGFGGGSLKSAFAGAIIIDDPHKADEATSPVSRNSVIDWFGNTLESRANNRDTPIVLIMQRLHQEDLSGFLLGGGNGETWEHLCLPAIQDDGTALWPEKHNIEELTRMERANPYVFAGQYMQSPAPRKGGLFKVDQISIIDSLPAGKIKWVRGWDLAASKDAGCFTVGVKLGQTDDGRLIVGDVARDRVDTDRRDNMLVSVASQDGRSVKISLPQDPGQAGKSQKTYIGRLLTGYNFIITQETGSKEVRADGIASQSNIGNLVLMRGDWNKEFLDELRLFPMGKYSDQVDALSRAFDEFNKDRFRLKINPEILNHIHY